MREINENIRDASRSRSREERPTNSADVFDCLHFYLHHAKQARTSPSFDSARQNSTKFVIAVADREQTSTGAATTLMEELFVFLSSQLDTSGLAAFVEHEV